MRKFIPSYRIEGTIAIFTLKCGEELIVDSSYAQIVSHYPWRLDKYGYAFIRPVINGKRVVISLHRFITSAPCDKVVDHINHNKLDNRKSNLRVVTQTENRMNSGMDRRNKSGVTGVFWNQYLNKWIAYISIKGKFVRIGSFNEFDESVHARKESEQKYYGEFAYKAKGG